MPNNPTPITAKEHLSDEIKFLIACCQTDPSGLELQGELSSAQERDHLGGNSDTPVVKTKVGFDAEFIQKQIEIIDQQQLINLSLRHGILPLVYLTIKANTPVTINSQLSTLINELKAHYQTIAQRNMLMSAELIRIMRLLEENNIEALAFKGPTLAQMAYGDITLRQYADLDVLVKKEDIYKIDILLQSQGYERLLALTPVQEDIWIKYAHDLGLIHPDKGVHFEMHWSFLDEDYPMQIDLGDFWSGRQEVKLNRYTIPTFSDENLLVYLCIHGSKHLWERIEWIKDIDLLVQKGEIDWKEVIEKSEAEGFQKMIYLGLALTSSLFHTPLPVTIEEKIRNHPQVDELITFIFESWQSPKSTLAKTSATLKLFPGIKEQAIYLHKVILKPSFNEYWAVDLPKGMYWGYYLVRPYLLLKKYFS